MKSVVALLLFAFPFVVIGQQTEESIAAYLKDVKLQVELCGANVNSESCNFKVAEQTINAGKKSAGESGSFQLIKKFYYDDEAVAANQNATYLLKAYEMKSQTATGVVQLFIWYKSDLIYSSVSYKVDGYGAKAYQHIYYYKNNVLTNYEYVKGGDEDFKLFTKEDSQKLLKQGVLAQNKFLDLF